MDLDLAGRVAIVTGASRGLGAAIVEAFVAEGMAVLAVARDTEALATLAAGSDEQIEAATCDMADTSAVEALPDVAVAVFGRLDVVVNNAGVAAFGSVTEMGLDRWEELLAVDLLAPVALTRAAGRHLLSQGHGKVINVASTAGLRGKPTLAAYSAAKGALLRFTEALAGEWAPLGVQVNAIAPGAFATDAQAHVLDDPDRMERRLRAVPAGRMGVPSEIGTLACYLASPASDFVTGATYVIDGGEAATL